MVEVSVTVLFALGVTVVPTATDPAVIVAAPVPFWMVAATLAAVLDWTVTAFVTVRTIPLLTFKTPPVEAARNVSELTV